LKYASSGWLARLCAQGATLIAACWTDCTATAPKSQLGASRFSQPLRRCKGFGLAEETTRVIRDPNHGETLFEVQDELAGSSAAAGVSTSKSEK